MKDWPLQMESLTELEYLDMSYNSISQVEGGPLAEFVNLAYLGDMTHPLNTADNNTARNKLTIHSFDNLNNTPSHPTRFLNTSICAY